jgi:hypothetical protein
MNTSGQIPKIKYHYTQENDHFLKLICEIMKTNPEKVNWKDIRKYYNKKFDDSKSSKQLRKYFHRISGALITGKLSNEEREIF